MKNFLRYANLLVLAAGAVGILLMLWLFSGGTDERGLYPAFHPAWILLGLLTVAVLVTVWLMVRQAGANRSYRKNFPASVAGAIGYAAAAIALVSNGLAYVGSGKNGLYILAGIVGILGGLGLIPAVLARFRGKRSKWPVHMLPCFFFALELFMLGQKYGSEPEMYRYLYHFWAVLTTVPACYWLWSFDVNMGKRRSCLFWCLVAGYFNLVATVDSYYWLLHSGIAVWMLISLPKLGHLPKQQRPKAETVPVEADTAPSSLPADADFACEAPVDTPAQPPFEAAQPAPNPLAVELPDPEAVLDQLLQDWGQEENP